MKSHLNMQNRVKISSLLVRAVLQVNDIEIESNFTVKIQGKGKQTNVKLYNVIDITKSKLCDETLETRPPNIIDIAMSIQKSK
jgi:hypothetical protein